MGLYRIEIEAVGGHGCQRGIGNGATNYGCQSFGCPDCEARRFVNILRHLLGNAVTKAVLTHWPGTPESVEDDLLANKRKGSF